MTRAAVYYHPDFAERGYTTLRHRVKPGFDALRGMMKAGLFIVRTPEITPDHLNLLAETHSPNHIASVKREGFHEVALLSAAGVVEAADALFNGLLDFAFCFVGTAGHHASRNGSWGFCYYNDVAMAVARLRQSGCTKVLILDVDPHFGDGTREYFGLDPNIIHINLHEDDQQTRIYHQYNNYDYGIDGADDRVFLSTLDAALDQPFGFEICIVIFGHDSHCIDYGSFYLTDRAYPEMAKRIKAFAAGKPVLFVLSGGSIPEVAASAIPAVISVFTET